MEAGKVHNEQHGTHQKQLWTTAVVDGHGLCAEKDSSEHSLLLCTAYESVRGRPEQEGQEKE